MKIISLQAENFKRLQAIEITPDGNFVQITGRNGQGKSSTLDAIWVALAGLDASPKKPIRKGAESARIRLDLGDIKVTRHFKETASGAFTSSLSVESAEGARYPTPQKMLDNLIGALSFDPVAFIAMDAKTQFDYCRRFAPTVDFQGLAAADKADRAKRTAIGNDADQALAAADAIKIPAGTPELEIDETALTHELQKAGETNTEIAVRSANREKMMSEIKTLLIAAADAASSTDAATLSRQKRLDQDVEDVQLEIERLSSRIQALRTAAALDIHNEKQRITNAAQSNTARAAELQSKLDGAPQLPSIVDISALLHRIELARETNVQVRRLGEKTRLSERARVLSVQYKELTESINNRESNKRTLIAAAKLPIDGLSFGDGAVLFHDVPLDQASDAEKLRVSVALSMAANPKLKVVFIRNGSLLDEEGLRLVAQMAEERDVQVWIERVSSDGKVGIVLENGLVKEWSE